jgi:hypothetical protein
METEFALSRLAEIARTPKRAVQLWADFGVIKADPSTMTAGSGVHRRFKRDELIVACVVAPFAKQKIAIGGLKTVSDAVRFYLQKHQHLRRLFDEAIAGRGRNYLLAYWSERKDGELYIGDFNLANKSEESFFDKMSQSSKQPVKVDVIALNEVLRDVPAES